LEAKKTPENQTLTVKKGVKKNFVALNKKDGHFFKEHLRLSYRTFTNRCSGGRKGFGNRDNNAAGTTGRP
jgi:hypothetical protein